MPTNFFQETIADADISITDDHGLKNKHGVDDTELINLCGGIPLPGATHVSIEGESSSADVIEIHIDCDQLFVACLLNFDERIIDNHSMFIHQPQLGTGKRKFVNQWKAARANGFLKFNALATAGDEEHQYEGYVFLAKLGYQMKSSSDLHAFRKFLDDNHIAADTTLCDVVLDERYCQLWREQGFSWYGEFALSDDCDSLRQLRYYFTMRGCSSWMD